MKALKLVLLTAALFIGMKANAQLIPFSIGIKGGVNMSNFSGDVDNKSNRAGFNAGLTARLNLPASLYVASGVEITQKGAKYDGDNKNKVKANPLYLQIPAHLGYKINLIPTTRLLIHAGPYWAYGIGGKVKTGGEKKDFFGSANYQAKKNDFGLGLGVGLEVWKFGVDVGYDFGLSNISRNSDVKMRNRNGYLSFSYRFM